MQQGDLGFLTVGKEGKAHALAVGHRSPDNDLGTTTDTLPRWIGGLLEQSVFRGYSGVKTVCEEHGLHEKGQFSWLNARTRCPRH